MSLLFISSAGAENSSELAAVLGLSQSTVSHVAAS
jgi:DNA-binding MarR family transcriptional regulator